MPTARPPSRAERLDLLARMLGERAGVTAQALAGELGLSVRSVFRDLEALRERGIPVEASRGRGGGLRLDPRWGLGKVPLASGEALCTLLALAISERLDFPILAPELARARRKIVDAFPAAERRRLAPLRERVLVGPPASPAVRASYRPPDAAAMRQLEIGFVRERVVRVEYVKENGELTKRRLEPHAMAINWPAWYLLGYDDLRAEPRTFRFDRFVKVEVEEASAFRARPKALAEKCLGGQGDVLARPL